MTPQEIYAKADELMYAQLERFKKSHAVESHFYRIHNESEIVDHIANLRMTADRILKEEASQETHGV